MPLLIFRLVSVPINFLTGINRLHIFVDRLQAWDVRKITDEADLPMLEPLFQCAMPPEKADLHVLVQDKPLERGQINLKVCVRQTHVCDALSAKHERL